MTEGRYPGTDANLQCHFSQRLPNAYWQGGNEGGENISANSEGSPDKCVYSDPFITNRTTDWDTYALRGANPDDRTDAAYLAAARELIQNGRFNLSVWGPNRMPEGATDAEWAEITAGRPTRNDGTQVLIEVHSRGRFAYEPYGLHVNFRTHSETFGMCNYLDVSWVNPLNFSQEAAFDIIMRQDPEMRDPRISRRDASLLPISSVIPEWPICATGNSIPYPPACNNFPYHYHVSVTPFSVAGERVYFDAEDPCVEEGGYRANCANEALNGNNFYDSHRTPRAELDLQYVSPFQISTAVFADFNGDNLPDLFVFGRADFSIAESADIDENGLPGPCTFDPAFDRDLDDDGINNVCFKASTLFFGTTGE